jgi:hypothetical protein
MTPGRVGGCGVGEPRAQRLGGQPGERGVETLSAHVAELLPVIGDVGVHGRAVPIGLPAHCRSFGQQPVLVGEVGQQPAGVFGVAGIEGGGQDGQRLPGGFQRNVVTAGSLSIFVQFFALFGFIFIVLQYLQLIRGDSALVSAVSMLPMAAAMLLTSQLAAALVSRLGTRTACAAGLALIAAALVVLAQLTAASGYWLLAVGLIPLGVGMGLAMTPATSRITSALPAAQQGVASALNDLSREVGGAVGIAVLASILAAGYQSHLPLAHLPAAQAGQARSSVAVAARMGGAVAAQAHSAFADGMHLALYIAAAAVATLLSGHR